MTGADSAEMGQGGMRVNMVPNDGGNSSAASSGQLRRRRPSRPTTAVRRASACLRELEADRQQTFNPNNTLTNVGVLDKIWDINPSVGGPIIAIKVWFYYTFRTGLDQDQGRQLLRQRTPRRSSTTRHHEARPRRRAHHRASPAGSRGRSAGRTRSRSITTTRTSTAITGASRRPFRPRPRHPGDADQLRHVTKWTRTHTNRLLLEAGFGIYDQEYTELYQPRSPARREGLGP